MTIQRFENGSRFCRVLSHNGTVYLSGMTADDTTGDVVQTVTIWLRDIADFDRMNSVWDGWIDSSAMPVRATVEARLGGDTCRVEIMVTAAL
jgi:enamine deaminase RidA (YjgF/YER057c/UK114 family)